MVAPTLLTAGQCAARLGVSRGLIYAALQSGALPAFRFGRPGRRGTWRVAESDLDRWVQTLKAGGPVPPPQPARPPGRLRHVTLD